MVHSFVRFRTLISWIVSLPSYLAIYHCHFTPKSLLRSIHYSLFTIYYSLFTGFRRDSPAGLRPDDAVADFDDALPRPVKKRSGENSHQEHQDKQRHEEPHLARIKILEPSVLRIGQAAEDNSL